MKIFLYTISFVVFMSSCSTQIISNNESSNLTPNLVENWNCKKIISMLNSATRVDLETTDQCIHNASLKKLESLDWSKVVVSNVDYRPLVHKLVWGVSKDNNPPFRKVLSSLNWERIKGPYKTGGFLANDFDVVLTADFKDANSNRVKFYAASKIEQSGIIIPNVSEGKVIFIEVIANVFSEGKERVFIARSNKTNPLINTRGE